MHEVTALNIKNLEETLKPHCDSHKGSNFIVTFCLPERKESGLHIV